MSYKCFEVTVENKIAHIVLNRPEKRNSMIPEFWDELPSIVRELDANAQARVIVISSTGPHFTSGIDTAVFSSNAEASDDPKIREKQNRVHGARLYDTVNYLQQSFTCLEECRVPVLAAIQGGVIGGGVDLITACDMRYMTADSFLTIFEINIGMTADVGTFPRITKLLPEGVVKELAYTGRRMSAAEAKSLGFVNEIFADQDSLLLEVMKIAELIASKAPLAIYGSKRIINYSRDHSTADGLDYIGIWNASMLQNAEIMEAMTAASEKRPADFVDIPAKRKKMGSGIVD
ncbi:MAG: crotonase/enoyl-CoA hydratase family protein [Gammaproteobacteria bacterium]|nr:crotonase/enoyl-CoA hydratase family protein [Pseudomonadales bacterium]MBT5718713.1 crotonase/enoyl-CoA hydratase family protein [Gammaproteobacteria bacterium]MBT6481038.1 crotonase/enoyl-CoA hydratase family protein [Gammaproteobacteria bacterium]MBT7227228.1 crotonase/enoyl-CoA hydratase family protein [Gammaproteobacteria bacterium]MDB3908356.1 crotonase/enoyl-CoA hydratase family protein [Gammaproteobacteria bacterium]